MTNRRLAAALTAVALAIGVAAWVWSRSSTTSAVGAEVKVGYSRLRISLPIFVAAKRGLFAKHGVAVQLVMYDTAQPLMQALIQGSVDVGGYTAFPIAFAAMQKANKELLFSTVLLEDEGHRISYLLKRVGDTRVNAITDLQGKAVGILPTIAYKAWLEIILKKSGVDPSTVAIQSIEPQLEVQALVAGGVAALFTNDPVATAALAAKKAEYLTMEVLVPKYLGTPFWFGSFNLKPDWEKSHPREAKGLISALDEAIDVIAADPSGAKADMRDFLPETFKDHAQLYPESYYLPSAKVDGGALQRAADQYVELGIVPSRVAVESLVYPRPR